LARVGHDPIRLARNLYGCGITRTHAILRVCDIDGKFVDMIPRGVVGNPPDLDRLRAILDYTGNRRMHLPMNETNQMAARIVSMLATLPTIACRCCGCCRAGKSIHAWRRPEQARRLDVSSNDRLSVALFWAPQA